MVLTVLSLVFVSLDSRGSSVTDAISSTLRTATAPLSTVAGGIGKAIGKVFGVESEQKKKIVELEAQLAASEAKIVKTQDLEKEVEALKALNSLNLPVDTGVVNASVITLSASSFETYFMIDVGSLQGVKSDMPVVMGGALLGRIVEAGRSRSKVRVLSSSSEEVGVRIGANAELGVISGSGKPKSLLVKFVSLDAVIEPGDSVVTSGLLASPFPAGIPVGRVANVRSNIGGTELEVEVTPLADFEHPRFVSVLLYGGSPGVTDVLGSELPLDPAGSTASTLAP